MAAINISLLQESLKRYAVQNKNVSKSDFGKATTVPIDAYCKKVTKIKGLYDVLDSVFSHVVQAFRPQWDELGEMSVRDKELKNFRLKVNYGFVPAAVLGTALAEWYEEDKKPTEKEIAKYIIDWLLIQVKDDVSLLSMIGEFNAGLAYGQFGHSLNGWNKIIEDTLANVNRPCYKIPLDVFTEVNAVENFTKYERNLPKLFKSKIKQIHCSSNVKEMYEIDFDNTYGARPSYKDADKTFTKLGKREIVGHDDLADDKMWATFDGNMLNLIDVIDNPATFTDVQVQDYKIKMFMEFTKGWDFMINEAACVADFENEVLGLGDANLMKLYYPHQI